MRNFISLRHPPLLRHRRDDEERDYTTHTQKIITDDPVLRLGSGHSVPTTEIQD